MSPAIQRLVLFAEGAKVADVYDGKAGGELMRRDISELLAAADQRLAWTADWDDLRAGEEVLLAILDLATNRLTRALARLQRLDGKPPRGALAVRQRRRGDWVVWQSTWDGRPLPETFRPYAFARPAQPEPEADADQ